MKKPRDFTRLTREDEAIGDRIPNRVLKTAPYYCFLVKIRVILWLKCKVKNAKFTPGFLFSGTLFLFLEKRKHVLKEKKQEKEVKKKGREKMKEKRTTYTIVCIIALIGAIMVMPATAQLADTPWPMFHHDLNHTGLSPYTGPDTNATKWTYSNTGRVSLAFHSSNRFGWNPVLWIRESQFLRHEPGRWHSKMDLYNYRGNVLLWSSGRF